MELYWKAAAGALLAAVLIIAVARQEKDISVLLAMGACCLVGTAAVSYLVPVLDLVRELASLSDSMGEMTGILLKAVGIAIVSEVTAGLCADSGSGSLGKMVQMLGSAGVIYLSIPIFQAVLTVIREILGEL